MIKGREYRVSRLKKYLYQLKQSPRARYNSYLISSIITKNKSKPTLNTKVYEQGQIMIFCIYIYDIIFIENISINKFKSVVEKKI